MISLTEAKSHLRAGDDEDEDIALKLKLAAAIVTDYAGVTGNQEIVREDYATDAEYSAAVDKSVLRADIIDAATLLVIGELYANREALSNPLSPTVKIILDRLRVPSFA